MAMTRPNAAWARGTDMDELLTPGRSVLRNSIILGVFAICTVGVIAFIQQATSERIAIEQQRMQMRALHEILPDDQHDNDLLQDSFSIADQALLQLPAPGTAWRARQNGAVNAVILPVVTLDGYSIGWGKGDGKVLKNHYPKGLRR